MTENAGLTIEASESLDSNPNSTALSDSGKHEDFHSMLKDYDFSSIELDLKICHRLDFEDIENIYPCSLMQENMYIGQTMG